MQPIDMKKLARMLVETRLSVFDVIGIGLVASAADKADNLWVAFGVIAIGSAVVSFISNVLKYFAK